MKEERRNVVPGKREKANKDNNTYIGWREKKGDCFAIFLNKF
jgi:hypothetical protein